LFAFDRDSLEDAKLVPADRAHGRQGTVTERLVLHSHGGGFVFKVVVVARIDAGVVAVEAGLGAILVA
jgi:hypothetical protein